MKKYFPNYLAVLSIAVIAILGIGGTLLSEKKEAKAASKIQLPSIIEYLVDSYSNLLSEDLEEVVKGQKKADVKGFFATVSEEKKEQTAKGKIVYLTFDDGPNEPYTSKVLDILDKEGVKTIFFVCGQNIERHPDTLIKIKSKGHLIGNHGYSHSGFVTFTGLGMEEEIEKNNKLIKKIVGETTNFHRPPFGFLTPWVKEYLEKNKYKIVLPDVIAYDWQDEKTPEEIEKDVLGKVKPGSIIVLHDGRGVEIVNRQNMVTALPRIIQKLKEKGYVFKQVDQNTETKFNLSRLQNLMMH